MGEWRTVPLPDVLDFREGPGIMATDFREQGVPLIRLAGLKRGAHILDGANHLDPAAVMKRWKQFQLLEGDVLLSTSASLGEVARVTADAVGAVPYTGIISFRPINDRIDPNFIQYMLTTRSFKAQIEAMGVGSVMKHFGPSHLRQMTVAYPDRDTQRAIAEVLGALDDKIAANNRVVAAAEGLMIHLADTAQESAVVADLVEHVRIAMSPDSFADVVAHYSLPAFDAGQTPERDSPDAIKSNKFALTEPCVLVSKLNPRIPRIWNLYALPDEMAVASTEFVVLVPRKVSTSELWAALRAPGVSTELQSLAAGTSGSHQRVKPAELLSVKVKDPRRLPDIVRDLIGALGGIVNARRLENVRVAQTRDELLPLLMSGKVRVRDAEEVVDRVV